MGIPREHHVVHGPSATRGLRLIRVTMAALDDLTKCMALEMDQEFASTLLRLPPR
jgi:hypothetical protein